MIPMPLIEGESISLHGEPVAIGAIHRRNWSSVATGWWRGQRVFVKQFVDRLGRPHTEGFEGDITTHRSLLDPNALPIHCRTPRLHGSVPDRLIAVMELVPSTTIDDLVAGTLNHGHCEKIGKALVSIIEHRRARTASQSVVELWKGFDPKNIGVTRDGTLVVFDFGPPVRTTSADATNSACALALASAWRATPSSDWWLADDRLLRSVAAPIARSADRAAVIDRLDALFQHRLVEPQRTGAARAVKQAAVLSLGRIYRWRALQIFDSLTTTDHREGTRHAVAS